MRIIKKIEILFRLLSGERFEDERHNRTVRTIYEELRKKSKGSNLVK